MSWQPSVFSEEKKQGLNDSASEWLGQYLNLGLSDAESNLVLPVLYRGAGKGPVMSPGIHPHSAGLNRISPAVSYLNGDAEGKGEALTFQTNDWHSPDENPRKLAAPGFVREHCCFVPAVQLLIKQLPPCGAAERTGTLERCGDSQSPVAASAAGISFSKFEKSSRHS